MIYTLLQRSAAFFVVLYIFLHAPFHTHAETFTLPQQFHHIGLTFLDPLTFSQSEDLPQQKTTIQFIVQGTIEIQHEEENNEFEKIIISPTFENLTTTTITVMPTPTLYIQQSEDPSPTLTPSPQQLLTPTTTTPTAAITQSVVGGLSSEKLFSMSNAYRQSKGLAAFIKDERSCSLAATRAPEIAGEVASGTLHSGLQARALPYWNTENIISMNSEEAAFNWWINDQIHHDAIVGNYTYSCVACSGNSCAQEFTNFQPK